MTVFEHIRESLLRNAGVKKEDEDFLNLLQCILDIAEGFRVPEKRIEIAIIKAFNSNPKGTNK